MIMYCFHPGGGQNRTAGPCRESHQRGYSRALRFVLRYHVLCMHGVLLDGKSIRMVCDSPEADVHITISDFRDHLSQTSVQSTVIQGLKA